jgi:hypothetical protein
MTIAVLRRTPACLVASACLVVFRRASACLVALGFLALGLAVPASAAPTITLQTTALPIPGIPGSGDILGAGAVIQVRYMILGTEYGGAPPPVTGLRYFAPAGAKLHAQGFATCSPTVIQADGLGPCPKRSLAGPKGSAGGFVSFGNERVHETVSVQPFFAPGDELGFYAYGTTPVSLEILSTGHVVSSASPFGLEVIGEIPLVESVPGALDASITEISVEVGAGYKRGKQTISYITLPRKCPHGGLPVKSEMTFLGGATAAATFKMPCPKGVASS